MTDSATAASAVRGDPLPAVRDVAQDVYTLVRERRQAA